MKDSPESLRRCAARVAHRYLRASSFDAELRRGIQDVLTGDVVSEEASFRGSKEASNCDRYAARRLKLIVSRTANEAIHSARAWWKEKNRKRKDAEALFNKDLRAAYVEIRRKPGTAGTIHIAPRITGDLVHEEPGSNNNAGIMRVRMTKTRHFLYYMILNEEGSKHIAIVGIQWPGGEIPSIEDMLIDRTNPKTVRNDNDSLVPVKFPKKSDLPSD